MDRPYSPVKEVDVRRGGGSDPPENYMGTDYLSAYIREEVKRIDPVLYTDEMIDHGGLRIYTSINYEKQPAAWNAIQETLPNNDDPQRRRSSDPAALVSVDDQGLIRAMVGSRHRFHPAALSAQDSSRRTRTTTPSSGTSRAPRSSPWCWPRPSGSRSRCARASMPRAS